MYKCRKNFLKGVPRVWFALFVPDLFLMVVFPSFNIIKFSKDRCEKTQSKLAEYMGISRANPSMLKCVTFKRLQVLVLCKLYGKLPHKLSFQGLATAFNYTSIYNCKV